MAVVNPAVQYPTLAEARLDSPRVLYVRFADGHEDRVAIGALPFASGPTAEEVHLVADGDLVEVVATSGDFVVTADELWGLVTGTISASPMAALVGRNLRAVRKELGLSLKDAEALSGIAAPNIHTLEAGATAMRLDTLTRLAGA